MDKRVRLLTEIMSNIRAVKLYAYEKHFGDKVAEMRETEHKELRMYGLIKSAIVSIFYFVPILATIREW